VARNRKRAKERRSRRPAGGVAGQPGLATARTQRTEPTPDALEHATPDVEIAEAQMALGRPELADDPTPVDGLDAGGDQAAPPPLQLGPRDEVDAEDSDTASQLGAGEPRDADEPDDADEEFEADAPDTPDADLNRGRATASGSELATSSAGRPGMGNRLVTFLQGSWRELQRVQWPDRRQVMQATGVVIGFVIVAGLFLGAADFLAGKLVNFILK
jgi:preprotein translocase subunit SecE